MSALCRQIGTPLTSSAHIILFLLLSLKFSETWLMDFFTLLYWIKFHISINGLTKSHMTWSNVVPF